MARQVLLIIPERRYIAFPFAMPSPGIASALSMSGHIESFSLTLSRTVQPRSLSSVHVRHIYTVGFNLTVITYWHSALVW